MHAFKGAAFSIPTPCAACGVRTAFFCITTLAHIRVVINMGAGETREVVQIVRVIGARQVRAQSAR